MLLMKERPTLTSLVALYLLRCEVEGKSPRTVRAYRETLTRFLAAVPQSDPTRVAPADIYSYLGAYTHLTLETRHRYFREVRCFFNWLVDAEHLERSPFRGMRNVRVPLRIKQPFSSDDIARLLASCPDTPAGIRDRAMLFTLLDTGVRCSELVQLNLQDLDLDDGRLRVLHGKGNKQRVVPFAARCRAALVDYLSARGREPGPLFLASTGHGILIAHAALKPNGLKQMLRRLARASGVSTVHAHRFRHTFATWAIQHDARELDVQYLLGHASGDMVRRYSSSYRSEQAALRHINFSPGDQMLQAPDSPQVA